MDELAVRQHEEQRHNDAQMNDQQQAHRRCLTHNEQQQARGAGQYQKHKKRGVYDGLLLIGDVAIAARFQHQQTGNRFPLNGPESPADLLAETLPESRY